MAEGVAETGPKVRRGRDKRWAGDGAKCEGIGFAETKGRAKMAKEEDKDQVFRKTKPRVPQR